MLMSPLHSFLGRRNGRSARTRSCRRRSNRRNRRRNNRHGRNRNRQMSWWGKAASEVISAADEPIYANIVGYLQQAPEEERTLPASTRGTLEHRKLNPFH